MNDTSPAANSNDVSLPSKDHDHMVERAKMPRALMGGTREMRKQGEIYLPKEPAESPDAFQNRLRRTTLFNAMAKTVSDMTGKVFNKAIILEDDVPSKIVEFAEDIDLTGRHINIFASDVFADGMVTGVGYILTDMPPPVTRPDGQPVTLADEQAAANRPYLVYIPMENLIGWQSTTIGGAETLTQIRILECVSEPDGEFLEKEIEQIKVIEPGKWRTFRKVASDAAGTAKIGDWVLHAEGVYSLKKITLAPFYTNRTEFMMGAPPLEKLAELNVSHWQSQSDQRNILHVARVPILFWAGKTDDDRVIVGANSMMFSSNDASTLTYTEHSGAAIGAGDKDLTNIENQMQAMGLLLTSATPGQSATGEMCDDAKENAPLAKMARSLGDAIEQSFGFMAEYMGLGEDAGGSVIVNTDFGIQAGNGSDLQWLTQAVGAGDLSKQTYWEELQRRGTLSDSFDPDVEKDRLDSESPVLPDPGPGNGMNLGGLPGAPVVPGAPGAPIVPPPAPPAPPKPPAKEGA